MIRHAFTAGVDAPRWFLYDLWTDPSRLPEWTHGLTRVGEVTGLPGVVGTKYRVWYGPLDERVEVIAAEFPFYVRTRASFGTIKIETAMAFEQTNTGTRLRLAWFGRGLKGRAWARLLSIGDFRWTFRAELERFAQLAEREYAATGPREPSQLIPMMDPAAVAAQSPKREPALPLRA